ISSNFERMLFDLYEGDAEAIAELMSNLKESGSLKLSSLALKRARTLFASHCLSDDEMVEVIRDEFEKNGYLLDPHTAIGLAAGRKYQAGAIPMVCLGTAHPAKFPEAVRKSGFSSDPALPHHMEDLFDREEAYEVIAGDQAEVQKYMIANIRK
ncbi:MAG: threonine synthase, partial [Pseudomonadales bacterium]